MFHPSGPSQSRFTCLIQVRVLTATVSLKCRDLALGERETPNVLIRVVKRMGVGQNILTKKNPVVSGVFIHDSKLQFYFRQWVVLLDLNLLGFVTRDMRI